MDTGVSSFVMIDIADHARRYVYDSESLAPLEEDIFDRIRRYDDEYGPYLESHLKRVSSQIEGFLKDQGYEPHVAEKIARAFSLHDAGKISQATSIWQKTDRKPSQEIKDLRKEHCALGPHVLRESCKRLKINEDNPDIKSHLRLVEHFMRAHHERLDGTGPMGLPSFLQCRVLRIAAIIDEIDGKLKVNGKTLDTIFQELTGEKHCGKFDPDLVGQFKGYAEKTGCLAFSGLA